VYGITWSIDAGDAARGDDKQRRQIYPRLAVASIPVRMGGSLPPNRWRRCAGGLLRR